MNRFYSFNKTCQIIQHYLSEHFLWKVSHLSSKCFWLQADQTCPSHWINWLPFTFTQQGSTKDQVGQSHYKEQHIPAHSVQIKTT